MTEHLSTEFRTGVTRFKVPSPFMDLVYDDAAGVRYQVDSFTPGNAFSVDGGGNLVLPVTVSGTKYPVGGPSWVSFGPESWNFAVTASQGIGVTLTLNPVGKTNEELSVYEANVVLADLSAADADCLDKYVTTGRMARALNLLGAILS